MVVGRAWRLALLALPVGVWFLGRWLVQERPGRVSEKTLADLINRYARFSAHLSGTEADAETSKWVFEEVSKVGLEVGYQPYVLRDVWIPGKDGRSTGCQLILAGQELPCYVVQQPPRRFHHLQTSMRRILVVNVSEVYIPSAEDTYRSAMTNGTLPYDAVIVVNRVEGEEVTQPRPFDWNQSGSSPSLVPVVTVSKLQWFPANASVSLRLLGHWVSALGTRNVVAMSKVEAGCESRWRPVYMGTPMNGFFRAAGERGAGIAMLISLATMLPRCACWLPIFGFTSGHEQSDPGISREIIPYLQRLAEQHEIRLADIPFISIGAGLGNYAQFEGLNSEGPGSGTARLMISTSLGHSGAHKMMEAVLQQLSKEKPSFMDLRPGAAFRAQGAVRPALLAGMPVMNLVSGDLRGRFHLPSDEDASSVNLSSLVSIVDSFSRALAAAMCQ